MPFNHTSFSAQGTELWLVGEKGVELLPIMFNGDFMSEDIEIPDGRGTYALAFECDFPFRARIGALGEFDFSTGIYIYIGSALGPGGLRARIGRHLRKNKKLKWHLDYLSNKIDPVGLHCEVTSERLECAWAAILAEVGGVAPVAGFGSSDCSCLSHLLYFKKSAVYSINDWLCEVLDG